MNTRVHDVVIAGGGLAGLTLAHQLGLARPGIEVLVVEAAAEPPPDAAHKVGESCVEIAGLWFKETLGLSDHLFAEHLPKLGLRFFLPRTSQGPSEVTQRLEVGPIRNKVPTPFEGLLLPSFQLDRGRFERHLAAALPFGTALRRGRKVRAVELGEGAEPHRVTLDDGETLVARWFIDATGRRALLRRARGMGEPSPHKASAIWFRTSRHIRVDDWADAASWPTQMGEPIRWQSTCHFMGRGYWVWLIPLSSGCMSVGVVVDEAIHPLEELGDMGRTLAWLGAHEPQVAAAVETALAGEPPLDFHTRRQYPSQVRQTFSAERWGVTGDAGNFVDPLYSPGSDFISITNSAHCDLILRELTGEDISERVRGVQRYYDITYEQFLRVYRGAYQAMGNAQVMAAKIAFDTAFYWGWAALLARNGVLTCPDFMDSIASEVERMVRVQGDAQRLFARWNQAPTRPVIVDSVDQFDVGTLWRVYVSLVRPVGHERLRHRVRRNLDAIEAMYEVLRQRAQQDMPGLDLPVAPDALSDEVERVREECEALWLDRAPVAAR